MPDPDGRTRWRLDTGFLSSSWTCLWGQGCQGIHDEPRPELGDGCCSVGVVLADEEEARNVAALADTIAASRFQQRGRGAVVERRGEAGRWATVLADGACVFLNRPGFGGGAGCALHLAALDAGEDPLRWKPQTCSRLPIRVEERARPDGTVEVTVRAWRREDWGPGGATMAWWCTEAPEAYVAAGPLHERMAEELRDLLGDDVYDAARRALGGGQDNA